MLQIAKEMYRFLFEAFRQYSGDNWIWILFPIALFVVFRRGKKEEKKIFILVPAVWAVTIFNPYLAALFIEKFSFQNRYLRFYWMIPYFIAIAYAMVLEISRVRKKSRRVLVGICCAAMIVLLGKPVYWGKEVPPYSLTENSSFTENEILELSAVFHSEGKERPVVLYDGALLQKYRQYDPTVISLLSREDYEIIIGNDAAEFAKKEQIDEKRKFVYDVFFYENYKKNRETFCSMLSDMGVDYVVSVSSELNEYLSASSAERIGQTEHYTVWKTEQK